MKKLTTLLSASLILFAYGSAEDRLRLDDVIDPLPEIDTSLPAPHESMRLEIGERHWYHHEIVQYLDTLAESSPRMTPLGEHARSHGRRPLVSYAISTPENIERLDEIRQRRKTLIDPSAKMDLDDEIAVLHMGYAIHGNEPSTANVTPLLAYYLTAAQDPSLTEQLKKVLIILNPVFNPDGLDRFSHWTNSNRGRVPSKDPRDREHTEAFPSGRTNYYWFDLNRDWLPHQHPESQGRLKLFHEWKPNVQLDFHEQGSGSSYFFMPGKPERVNPLTPRINQELTEAIAEYHRKVFDKEGILYFSHEGYDDFFVGKGSTYPDLFGCVGILFEQASSRGVQQDTNNGLLRFPLTIANQFRTSLSSIEATAALRRELLEYQRSFYADNAKNQKASGHYLATAEGDPTRLREFARILQGHQIKVELLTETIEVDGISYPKNESISIPADQPQSTYLRSLWNRQIEFEENIFYDVSTWTLPLAFNLQYTIEPIKKVSSAPLEDSHLSARPSNPLPHSETGYLLDWRDSASPALLYALLETDANIRVATRPLRAQIGDDQERDFGYGTILVARKLGEPLPREATNALQAAYAKGVPVFPVASSGTRSGIDLGSRDFKSLKLPKVLLVTGPGISAYDAGEIWHLVDTRIQMPITMVETYRLAGTDFSDYTHVLLTNGLNALSENGLNKLKTFVKNGGILWVQGQSAVTWAIDKELTEGVWRKTKEQKALEVAKDRKDDDEPSKYELPERRSFAQARDDAAVKLVRGSIFNTSLDITHPIGYGFSSQELPVFQRASKFLDRSLNAYSTPVLYDKEPLLSGYISEENLELIAESASVIVDQQGSGAVVLCLSNPNFRAFWWGTQRILVNAIFFGDLLEEPQ